MAVILLLNTHRVKAPLICLGITATGLSHFISVGFFNPQTLQPLNAYYTDDLRIEFPRNKDKYLTQKKLLLIFQNVCRGFFSEISVAGGLSLAKMRNCSMTPISATTFCFMSTFMGIQQKDQEHPIKRD